MLILLSSMFTNFVYLNELFPVFLYKQHGKQHSKQRQYVIHVHFLFFYNFGHIDKCPY